MKILPELSMPNEPVRPGIPWSLGHLRLGFIWTAILAAIGCAVAAFIVGWRGVLGVAVGLVIVAGFFAVGSWAVAKIGANDDRLTFPAALGSYLIKIALLGGVLVALPKDGPIDIKSMAIAVVVGTVVWAASQIRYVVGKRLYYVDYTPPNPEDVKD